LLSRLVACVAVLAVTLVAVVSDAPASVSPARSSAWCSGAISWQSARQHVGQPVRVKARVVTAFYARSSRGRPTFLNLGYAYPDTRRLTVLVWGRNRVNFPRAPEQMFRAGTTICAQGVVKRYRGVAEIEVALWDPQDRLLSF
jgi:hypothetical protein